MLKISLYRIFCIDLRKLINPYSYRKDQSYRIDGRATSAIGERFPYRQQPCVPYALPRNSVEITGAEIRRYRYTNGNDTYIRECLDKTLQGRRNYKFGNTSGTWAQAYDGPLRRRSGSQGHRTGQAEREESQGILAADLRQRSEQEYIPGFFSTLARDIDV